MERGSTFYLKERVPADLAGRVKGQKVFIPVGGVQRPVTLGEFAQVSLRTRDPKVAKERQREAASAVQEMWARFRQEAATGPVRLTGKQVAALAGQYYHGLRADHEDNPGSVDHWDTLNGVAEELVESPRKTLENALGEEADRLLQGAGLTVDADSRLRLLRAIADAAERATGLLRKRAQGDFSPDPNANRFPELPTPKAETSPPVETVTLTDLFNLWEADHLLGGGPAKTAKDFRRCLDSLAAFVGHEDAQRITPREVSDWCDHLQHDEGFSTKTVSGKYLVAVKRVFTVGKRKFRITHNPAEGVVVEVREVARERSKGLTDAEAKAILRAALGAPEALGKMAEDNKTAIRWGPWLCAYTGARITEMMQLRKEDVETHSGIPCLRITPAAGSTKTKKQWLVPVHPHLVEMGFLDVVKSRPGPYLFFQPKAGEDTKTRAGNVGKKVADWVREKTGVEDSRVRPNHGWRHRLKTEMRRQGIERWVMDAIQGHADPSASARYGDVPIEPLYEAIKKLPRYNVNEEPSLNQSNGEAQDVVVVLST